MATATLSARHKAFAHAYSASHNATAAARDAGYTENRASRTGYELVHRPDIAALIEKLDTAKRDASGVDEPWIVQRLVEIVERSMRGRLRTNGLGEPVVDPKAAHRSSTRITPTPTGRWRRSPRSPVSTSDGSP